MRALIIWLETFHFIRAALLIDAANLKDLVLYILKIQWVLLYFLRMLRKIFLLFFGVIDANFWLSLLRYDIVWIQLERAGHLKNEVNQWVISVRSYDIRHLCIVSMKVRKQVYRWNRTLIAQSFTCDTALTKIIIVLAYVDLFMFSLVFFDDRKWFICVTSRWHLHVRYQRQLVRGRQSVWLRIVW